MQVFRLFYKLLKANRKMIVIYFIVFIAMVVVLTKLQYSGEETKGFVADKLDIGIVDEDEGVYSKAIQEYFESKHNIRLIENDQEKIMDELYWLALDYVLVIPEGFSDSLINPDVETKELSNIKVPGSFSSSMFESELTMYNEKLSVLLDSGYSFEDATRVLMDNHEKVVTVNLASFVNQNQNDVVKGIFIYFPYLFGAVSVISIGVIMLKINEQEVKDRTECSCTPLRNRTLGMVAGVFVFSILIYAVALLIACILSGGKVFHDERMPYFMLNLLAMLVFFIGLSYLVGTISKNIEGLNGLVNVLSLSLCFLGGVFVPQEVMGEAVLKVARFIPTFWYIKNNNMIAAMTKATGQFMNTLLLQAGIMVVSGIAVFVLGVVISNAKRKRT